MNDLARLRLNQPQLASHSIDAAGLRELCLGEPQLAILFAQLIANLFLRLHAVRAFNGAEVLQTINHDQREQ